MIKTVPHLVTLLVLLGTSEKIWADDDFIVYSPLVTYGQSEVEMRGYQTQDGRSAMNGAGAFETSVAHTFTDWWKVEFYTSEYNVTPGLGTQFAGQELENTFQLTEAGQYPVDVGFLASYLQNHLPGMPNGVEFGPLLQSQMGPTKHILNLIWQKDIGGAATMGYNFRAAYSFSYHTSTALSPGLEAYYRPVDHAHQVGPAFSGEMRIGHGGKELEYSGALLYGVNYGAPDRTLIARLEYEFF
ncbi:MAG: hypothetical protein G3H99_06805 [Ferrovum sp.]|jgi:hypothetical protein|nr:hypothetical protein [Ferrovum sp.]NDU87786.1 hypothetical protein [Ferrovum sp.]